MPFLLIVCLVTFSSVSFARTAEVTEINLWKQTPHGMRLLFNLSGPTTHTVFTLNSPDRLVIDLKETILKTEFKPTLNNQDFIQNVRIARRNKDDLRIVLDLNVPVLTKSFLAKVTAGRGGHQLTVDINPKAAQNSAISTIRSLSAKSILPIIPLGKKSSTPKEKIVVAIDAGHGGIDSGAVGPNGTYEKEVVLMIAKELATLINQTAGLSAVMIREGDYFLKLRRRIELAREHQADLFISIHADAYPENKQIQGASVYMLSNGGASSEAAQWVAEKENAADLLGGISLSDKDDLLASVLLDLSQAGTLEASALVGNEVINALKKSNKVHYSTIQRASFMVLRSPDIPSILVETAFLSNPLEEEKLNSVEFRLRIAHAIFEGIQNYFAQHSPLSQLVAQSEF